MATTDTTACILCSRNCGLAVEVENGELTRIRGDSNHPASKGYICQKAARLNYYQNNRDRLRHPLRRESDGSFSPVSWDAALTDIAQRLQAIRGRHGGRAFATAGGGGQGNHLGGAYLAQLRAAMKSFNNYNSLGQEKTGDFWLNGRLFGSQKCHTTEDIEHSDFVIFLGCNPYQAHGIPNARDTLKAISKDPRRTMVVIDPRRTETARYADIHLQLKPGTDAYLLSAILGIIVQENLQDHDFLQRRCTGFEDVASILRNIPIEDYVRRADVPLGDVIGVAHGLAAAGSACVRADLGIQHSLHTTLNGYFEKLLYLITGNFGMRGGNNLHSMLVPILSDTDERSPRIRRTAYHGMFPVSGILPPNILPDEILLAGEDRIRALVVDSTNPMLSWPDTGAFEQAFSSLELLVVVDVAMTETARLAHYVLPASSQLEKWEFTGFNLEFPRNAFHLRHPLFEPLGDSLPEAEIYTRLLEKMGAIPTQFPVLSRIAKHEPEAGGHLGYMAALATTLATHKQWAPFAPSILYRTMASALPPGASSAALLLPLAMRFATRHPAAVRRAGHQGNRITLGSNLFKAILKERSGVTFSAHLQADVWSLLAHEDQKIHLAIPEMLAQWRALEQEADPAATYPFVLMAGERRAYNANQIYRDPAWRKVDKEGAMRIHPLDADSLQLENGEKALCASQHGQIEVTIERDDSLRQGVVTLPHGYGTRYHGSAPIGPEINRLTTLKHCDPLSRTPFHKYVPVNIYKKPAA